MEIIEHVQQKLRENPVELLNLKSQNVTVNVWNFAIVFGIEIYNEDTHIKSYHKMISFNGESELCMESIDIYDNETMSGNSVRFNRLYNGEFQLEHVSTCWYDGLSALQKDILHMIGLKIITDKIRYYDTEKEIITKLILNEINENFNSDH